MKAMHLPISGNVSGSSTHSHSSQVATAATNSTAMRPVSSRSPEQPFKYLFDSQLFRTDFPRKVGMARLCRALDAFKQNPNPNTILALRGALDNCQDVLLDGREDASRSKNMGLMREIEAYEHIYQDAYRRGRNWALKSIAKATHRRPAFMSPEGFSIELNAEALRDGIVLSSLDLSLLNASHQELFELIIHHDALGCDPDWNDVITKAAALLEAYEPLEDEQLNAVETLVARTEVLKSSAEVKLEKQTQGR